MTPRCEFCRIPADTIAAADRLGRWRDEEFLAAMNDTELALLFGRDHPLTVRVMVSHGQHGHLLCQQCMAEERRLSRRGTGRQQQHLRRLRDQRCNTREEPSRLPVMAWEAACP